MKKNKKKTIQKVQSVWMCLTDRRILGHVISRPNGATIASQKTGLGKQIIMKVVKDGIASKGVCALLAEYARKEAKLMKAEKLPEDL